MIQDEMIQAARKALEALCNLHESCQSNGEIINVADEICSLRAALEQPVKWQEIECPCCGVWQSLPPTTLPPAPVREWVGLTESSFHGMTLQQIMAMKYAESVLKEKNT